MAAQLLSRQAAMQQRFSGLLRPRFAATAATGSTAATSLSQFQHQQPQKRPFSSSFLRPGPHNSRHHLPLTQLGGSSNSRPSAAGGGPGSLTGQRRGFLLTTVKFVQRRLFNRWRMTTPLEVDWTPPPPSAPVEISLDELQGPWTRKPPSALSFEFLVQEVTFSEFRYPEQQWYPDPPDGSKPGAMWTTAQIMAIMHLRQKLTHARWATVDYVERSCWVLKDSIHTTLVLAGFANPMALGLYERVRDREMKKVQMLYASKAVRLDKLNSDYYHRHMSPFPEEEELRQRIARNLDLTLKFYKKLHEDAHEFARKRDRRFWRFSDLPLYFLIGSVIIWTLSGLIPVLPPWMAREFTRMWGALAEVELGPLVWLWGWVVGVDFEEAELPVSDYPTLQALFTRDLKPGARPVDYEADLVSPADSTVVALGDVTKDLVMNIKGQWIPVNVFLGRDAVDTRPGLKYAVLYLAPKAYHGYHAPADFEVENRLHFPGTMFSVHPMFVAAVGRVWTDNERVVLQGSWPYGQMFYGAVGAFNVGSIVMDTEPELRTNLHYQEVSFLHYPKRFDIVKGARVGGFKMGSSIVLVFDAPKGFEFTAEVGQEIRLGQSLGQVVKPKEELDAWMEEIPAAEEQEQDHDGEPQLA